MIQHPPVIDGIVAMSIDIEDRGEDGLQLFVEHYEVCDLLTNRRDFLQCGECISI